MSLGSLEDPLSIGRDPAGLQVGRDSGRVTLGRVAVAAAARQRDQSAGAGRDLDGRLGVLSRAVDLEPAGRALAAAEEAAGRVAGPVEERREPDPRAVART